MTICIIPARSGSKRLKNKNIKKINNVPLLGIVIKIALASKIFKKIIVSTDSKKIAKLAVQYGAEIPFMRSKKLSGDFTPIYEVLLNTVRRINVKDKYIFCIYPTAIFTKPSDLKKAFLLIKKANADMFFPTIKRDSNILRSYVKKGKYIEFAQPKFSVSRSQDLPEVFSDTGSFYIYKQSSLLKLNRKNTKPKKTITYPIDKKKTLDIHNSADFKRGKELFKKYKFQS